MKNNPSHMLSADLENNQAVSWPMDLNKVADLLDLHQIGARAVLEGLYRMKDQLDATNLPYSIHMFDHWLRSDRSVLRSAGL